MSLQRASSCVALQTAISRIPSIFFVLAAAPTGSFSTRKCWNTVRTSTKTVFLSLSIDASRLHLPSSSLRRDHRRRSSDLRAESRALPDLPSRVLPALQRGSEERRVSSQRRLGGRPILSPLPDVPHAGNALLRR